MKPLNRKSIAETPNRPIRVLQFGEGNFLRAFVDWIIDVMNEKTSFNSAVEIIQPIDKGMAQLLNAQDGLYHVILNGLQNGKTVSEKRLITSVVNAFNPYEDYHAFLMRAENPELKFIVSNTTEAGIAFDERDTGNATLPNSFPGKLTALLFQRFTCFKGDTTKGVTVIPCELIEKNGEQLRNVILQYIQHWQLPASFKVWIEEHNTFCNTLVDRIVPGFPKDTIQDIQRELGFEDNLVVTAEPFHLWVIEAGEKVQQTFPADQAGLQVKFVRDLTPYRTRKVRILNGAHTALVPVAYLRGLRTVRQAVDDSFAGDFLRRAIVEEIIPTLDLPTEELNQFANDVMERFQNPFIKHELSSIALNAISKYKVRVLPSVLRYQQLTGKLPTRLVQALAALIRFYKGVWKGETLPVNDTPEILTFFKHVWESNDNDLIVSKTLSNISFWGEDLTRIPGLQKLVSENLEELDQQESLAL